MHLFLSEYVGAWRAEGASLNRDHNGRQKGTASCFSRKVSFVNDRKIEQLGTNRKRYKEEKKFKADFSEKLTKIKPSGPKTEKKEVSIIKSQCGI